MARPSADRSRWLSYSRGQWKTFFPYPNRKSPNQAAALAAQSPKPDCFYCLLRSGSPCRSSPLPHLARDFQPLRTRPRLDCYLNCSRQTRRRLCDAATWEHSLYSRICQRFLSGRQRNFCFDLLAEVRHPTQHQRQMKIEQLVLSKWLSLIYDRCSKCVRSGRIAAPNRSAMEHCCGSLLNLDSADRRRLAN